MRIFIPPCDWALPQGLGTGDSPTFKGLTLTDMTEGSVLFAGPSGLLSQDNTNFFWNNSTNRLIISSLQIVDSIPFSDSAGTLTLQNIDVLDATTETTIENAIDTLPNLTSIQGQTVSFSGSLTVESASVLNQDTTTDASPTHANLFLGVDDTTLGQISLFGNGTGSTHGGEVRLYMAADYDTVQPYFLLEVDEDELIFTNPNSSKLVRLTIGGNFGLNLAAAPTSRFEINGTMSSQLISGSVFKLNPTSTNTASITNAGEVNTSFGFTNGSGPVINSTGSARICIDADNSGTGSSFEVHANVANFTASTSIFHAQENGEIGFGINDPKFQMHLFNANNAVFLIHGNAGGSNPILQMKDGNDTTNNTWQVQVLGGDLGFRHGANVAAGAQATTTRVTFSNSGDVGIGTAAIPHAGVGAAQLALEGLNASVGGPHMQFTTPSTNFPICQHLNWTHDNTGITFDAYFDGTVWKSSDAGSNFQLYKFGDILRLQYDSGITAGNTLTWNEGISLHTNGLFLIPGSFKVDVDGTEMKEIKMGKADIGAGCTGVNVYTVTFGGTAFANAPKVLAQIITEPGQSHNDVFAWTVKQITTSQFGINVYRVDSAGAAWGQALDLHWWAVEI